LTIGLTPRWSQRRRLLHFIFCYKFTLAVVRAVAQLWIVRHHSRAFMNPKTLKILIIGLALMIFGPVIGWVLTIAGFFHTATAMQQIQPGVMPDFQQTSSRMMSSIIPILIGVVLGAIGFFLFLYSLITHFFRSKP
jgi:hypothetical protein